jgi:phage terminase large subunit-like protein
VAKARVKRPPAGKKTSARFVRTVADEAALAAGYWYDEESADLVVDFIQTFCQLSKGEGAAGPMQLLPWQADELIRPLFGWKRPDGTRRFRKGYCQIPKKNGKSALCSAVSLYMTVADGERGADCAVAAVDQNQASIVFDECVAMVEQSPDLASVLEINRSTKRITCPATHSTLRALSSDASSKEGYNLSFLCIDELHAWRDRKLWGALKYAHIARKQPICPLVITTAGEEIESLGHEQYEYAKKIIEGTVTAHEYLALIYAAPDDADFKDPEAWKVANPSLGTTITLEEMATSAAEAEAQGQIAINEFKRYRLDIWVKSDKRCIRMIDWNKPENVVPFTAESLYGRLCYGGLDIGWQNDLTAFVLIFPDDDLGCHVLPYVWIPQAAADEQERKGFNYSEAKADGHITILPGEVLDTKAVKQQILECRDQFYLRRINFDPKDCRELALSLRDEHGIEVVEHPQSYSQYNEPFRRTLELILAGRFRHGSNRLLTWAADNLKVRVGMQDDVMPARPKPGSDEKIDPMVAAIMGVAAWQHDPTGSVYDNRGIRTT